MFDKYFTDSFFKPDIEPDYVEIAEAGNLKAIDKWNGTTELVAVVAAFIDDVRLIDNILLKD